MRRAVLTFIVAAVVVVVLPAQQATARRFGLDDFSRVVRVADPQIAPDGRSIAVVVSRANLDEDRYEGDLVVVDVESGASRTLVSSRPGLTSPRWASDGQRLAFLAPVAASGGARQQVFVATSRGGDPQAITNAALGVQQFAWSPDGGTIAFATPHEPERKEGPERFNDSFEVFNEHYLTAAAVTPTHIWILPAAGGDARRLTSGTWTLPVSRPPGSPASQMVWTPDGASIAFARQPGRAGGVGGDGIQLVNVSDGAITPLHLLGTHPTYATTGGQIAFMTGGGVSVASADGSQARGLTQAIDRNLARGLWMPDGQTLLVGANDTTRVSLWLQPVDAKAAARRLDLGDLSPASSFFVDVNVGRNGGIAFTASSTTRPAELYYMPSVDGPVKRLTSVNAETAALPLGRTEAFEWSSDQFRPNGLLTYPPDFDPTQKYPIVLLIHGGPRAASLLSWSAPAQLMAAKGWLVFQPNYRGSDNLGGAFSSAIRGDAGDGPGRDVWAGLEAIKKRGIVNESRIGVSGWSYGGYMTVWMLGHYTGWRAAVAGAAVTDLLDQYNLNDGNKGAGTNSPWANEKEMERRRAQSPITYVSKIKTPTLIMSNTGDYRVTITQSYKLFHALRDHRVETSFIAYPIAGHNAADPVRQRDVQRRWIGWLDQHFGANASGGGR